MNGNKRVDTKKWSILDLAIPGIVICAIWFLFELINRIKMLSDYTKIANNRSMSLLLVILIGINLLGFAGSALLQTVLRGKKLNLNTDKSSGISRFIAIFIGILFALLVYGFTMLWSYLDAVQNVRPGASVRLLNFDIPSVILLFVLVSIIIPFAHGLFFRGFMFEWVNERTNSVVAVILCSVFSAAFGTPVPFLYGFIPAFVLSIALCAYMLKKRSILLATIAHGVCNFTYLMLFQIFFHR
jgi:membrane protease YdiL (CAAX protease family)